MGSCCNIVENIRYIMDSDELLRVAHSEYEGLTNETHVLLISMLFEKRTWPKCQSDMSEIAN